jgi:hypothetical protein
MKITEVNLTIPHYVILISATRNQCLVTKTELSAVEQGSWDKTKYYLYVKKPICSVNNHIVSLNADLKEEIYQGANYVMFNLKDNEINCIAYNLQTVFKIIHRFYLDKYNIYRKIPSLECNLAPIKAYYREILKKLKEMK